MRCPTVCALHTNRKTSHTLHSVVISITGVASLVSTRGHYVGGAAHNWHRRRANLLRSTMPVTPPHTPVPYAPSLEDAYLPDAAQIAEAVRGVVTYGK